MQKRRQGKLIPDLFYFSIKLSIRQKRVVSTLFLTYFSKCRLGNTIKTNFITFYLMIQRYAQFWFFTKGYGTSFFTTLLSRFFKKNVSYMYSINWPNFVAWLHLLLDILDNICILIFSPLCDILNFENSLSLLIKPFFYITKKPGQKCKYLKNEKSFNMK